MSERTINVNAEWYETVTAELKAKDKRIVELEAENTELRKAHNTPYAAYLVIREKHTALRDGLRGLAEKWVTEDDECDTEYRNGYDDGKEWCAAALLAQLGKESGDAS